MTAALVIGSTVCDVMVYLDRLPSREGDAHIDHQQWSLGGCAFNVVNILHFCGNLSVCLSPVGSGIYGDFIRRTRNNWGFQTLHLIRTGANGCCYCFVESDGERTFYRTMEWNIASKKEWLQSRRQIGYDFIYLCGLEVEEPTGWNWFSLCHKSEGQVIFAT